jgi:hypothetical protein
MLATSESFMETNAVTELIFDFIHDVHAACLRNSTYKNGRIGTKGAVCFHHVTLGLFTLSIILANAHLEGFEGPLKERPNRKNSAYSLASTTPSTEMENVASFSAKHGDPTILATRVSPRPFFTWMRVVVACAMIFPPMGFTLGPANIEPPSRLAATTWFVMTTATPNSSAQYEMMQECPHTSIAHECIQRVEMVYMSTQNKTHHTLKVQQKQNQIQHITAGGAYLQDAVVLAEIAPDWPAYQTAHHVPCIQFGTEQWLSQQWSGRIETLASSAKLLQAKWSGGPHYVLLHMRRY